MVAPLVVLIFCLLLPAGPPPIRVDVVEINHVVDGADVRLEQVIWWEWCQCCGRYEVRDWRFLAAAGWPRRTDAGWLSEWREDQGQFAVLSLVRRETWTRYDVEVEDRRALSEGNRKRIR